MKTTLINYIKAACPSAAFRTVEEPRAMQVVLAIAKEREKNVFTWNARQGIVQVNTANGFSFDTEDTLPPGDACEKMLDAIQESGEEEPGILVLLDFHKFARDLDPNTERVVKDLLVAAPSNGLFVIFLGLEFRIPASFERYVKVVDFKLPDRDELNSILDKNERDCAEAGIKLKPLANGQREEVIRAASGLTQPEAENAFALAVIEAEATDAKAERVINARTVYREKANAVKRSGHLEIIEPDPRGIKAMGGLDNIKLHLMQRKLAYTQKAKAYGLPSPRGILLIGVPGTGKSLTAWVIGAIFNVPVLRLDLGCLFAGIVGESEQRTRDVLALADAISPCVLWIDEIEKGLAGSSGSGNLDSGVGKRMLGTILTWQQQHSNDVYVLATANQVEQLPPELLRKGRST